MTFACIQCGECCSHLGQVHIIAEAYGGYRFRIRNVYTGEETLVRVDPDKEHLYAEKSIFKERPEACPFLRADPENRRVCCIVHATRPGICRDFSCWRLLIVDAAGTRAGRVMGSRHLVADDPALQELWDRDVRTLREPDDAAWEEEMTRRIRRAGYAVRR
ncbi:YkgJ family cysteine cluster protein [Methanoculleus sp. FWC-SCC1]|uniref:YkgJ family cysteine cluster protein n=1 Tax=Methanoculleus frigidifontis TaxID=2584085 RepID=A0ABT8MDK6_9EURY|nr:YkgJ family cysteine cluster protein [Methanoculleus sp. FWC-SCC1]MDN7025940.1 YkgJ family cysteine cluster protein [Methanoculleus sp. FWC-SCC1]